MGPEQRLIGVRELRTYLKCTNRHIYLHGPRFTKLPIWLQKNHGSAIFLCVVRQAELNRSCASRRRGGMP